MSIQAKQIPAGWSTKVLADICDILIGGTPSRDKMEYWDANKEGKNIWISIRDLSHGGKYISDSAEYISDKGVNSSNVKPIPKGNVLMSFKLTIGKTAITDKDVYTNEAIAAFLVKDKSFIDSNFLYYALPRLKYDIDTAVKGATLNKEKLKTTNIVFPSLDEQTRIAAILSKVDQEIEKVERIVEQTEKLKKGLMQKLLTKGIGHTKFKQTELGEVPEEWEVVTLKESDIEIIDGDRGENYPKKNEFMDEGYCLFLSNKNIKNDKFIFDECAFITEEKDGQLRKGKLKRFDIVLTTRGTVGNVAYFGDGIPFENIRLNSGMLIFRAGNAFASEFLYALFKSPLMKIKYTNVASGSAQPQLPIRSLEQIKIPIPPKEEQKKIATILDSLENLFSITKGKKKLLIKLKKGLMNDLLSGKVRINN